MITRNLITLSEAAPILGVSRQTVSELARRLGIETKPMPLNGRAKGLDEADMRRLKKALGIPAGQAKAAAMA